MSRGTSGTAAATGRAADSWRAHWCGPRNCSSARSRCEPCTAQGPRRRERSLHRPKAKLSAPPVSVATTPKPHGDA
eukprot:10530804-Lingulodinium_polyedra.AAC.1